MYNKQNICYFVTCYDFVLFDNIRGLCYILLHIRIQLQKLKIHIFFFCLFVFPKNLHDIKLRYKSFC